ENAGGMAVLSICERPDEGAPRRKPGAERPAQADWRLAAAAAARSTRLRRRRRGFKVAHVHGTPRRIVDRGMSVSVTRHVLSTRSSFPIGRQLRRLKRPRPVMIVPRAGLVMTPPSSEGSQAGRGMLSIPKPGNRVYREPG